MSFAREKGVLKGTILTSPAYFFSDSGSDLHPCISINEAHGAMSVLIARLGVWSYYGHRVNFPFRN